jgi:hypothetical protein
LQILFALPALFVQALQKVTFAVEQANTDQGYSQVGGTLDVVSGQNTQAARINGQGFMQAELRRKISYRMRPEHPCIHGAPGAISA